MRETYLESCKLVLDYSGLQIMRLKLSMLFSERIVTNLTVEDKQYDVSPIVTGRVNGYECYLILINIAICREYVINSGSSMLFISSAGYSLK